MGANSMFTLTKYVLHSLLKKNKKIKTETKNLLDIAFKEKDILQKFKVIFQIE